MSKEKGNGDSVRYVPNAKSKAKKKPERAPKEGKAPSSSPQIRERFAFSVTERQLIYASLVAAAIGVGGTTGICCSEFFMTRHSDVGLTESAECKEARQIISETKERTIAVQSGKECLSLSTIKDITLPVSISDCDEDAEFWLRKRGEKWIGTWTGGDADGCHNNDYYSEKAKGDTWQETLRTLRDHADECSVCNTPGIKLCNDTVEQLRETFGEKSVTEVKCDDYMSEFTFNGLDVDLTANEYAKSASVTMRDSAYSLILSDNSVAKDPTSVAETIQRASELGAVCSEASSFLEETDGIALQRGRRCDSITGTTTVRYNLPVEIDGCDQDASFELRLDEGTEESWRGVWKGSRAESCYASRYEVEVEGATWKDVLEALTERATQCSVCWVPEIKLCSDTVKELRRSMPDASIRDIDCGNHSNITVNGHRIGFYEVRPSGLEAHKAQPGDYIVSGRMGGPRDHLIETVKPNARAISKMISEALD